MKMHFCTYSAVQCWGLSQQDPAKEVVERHMVQDVQAEGSGVSVQNF